MNTVIKKLEYYIDTIPGKFRKIGTNELNAKPDPEKWNKKEILGHLADSAFNNLQRLIRVQYESGVKIVYYQNEWVAIQDYQNMDVDAVIQHWVTLNRQFLRVIRNFPQNKLGEEIDTGKTARDLHTAEFLITDYLEHMEHHFRQIFGTHG